MSQNTLGDLSRFAIPQGFNQIEKTPTHSQTKPRTIRGEFLRGPIPLKWLTAAAKLPGKSPLAVALAIHFEAGRRDSRVVKLTTAILERFAVKRKAKYSGLLALKSKGLVSVQSQKGKNPVVTILYREEADKDE